VEDGKGQWFRSANPPRVRGDGGSFTWEARVLDELKSRRYGTPYFGTHRVIIERESSAYCHAGEQIAVELWAVSWPFNRYLGGEWVNCLGGIAEFHNISPDPEFYFLLKPEKAGKGTARLLVGRTEYP
jgi:hypothetical protein